MMHNSRSICHLVALATDVCFLFYFATAAAARRASAQYTRREAWSAPKRRSRQGLLRLTLPASPSAAQPLPSPALSTDGAMNARSKLRNTDGASGTDAREKPECI